VDLTPANERSELLDLVGQVYARAKDTALAATVLAAKLRPWLTDTSSASSAYAAMARVQAAAGMVESARTSLADALKQIPSTPAAGVLAADWLDQTPPTDELTLRQYIERNPDLRLVRMAYARFLLRANRWQDSEAQLKALTASPQADIPEAWVILGALQLQLDRPAEAETSFKTFLSRISSAQAEAGSEAHSRGKTQAYLSLAHIAERAKRLDEARAWLDQVDTAEDALRIQTLRAALLAREGKLPEARTLIQSTPESQPGDALAKLKAEAQLLKEAGQTAEAYAVLNQASMQAPEDFDLVYERAMLAEKLGKTAEMERLLRSIIQAQPDNHNALNALGYSLADRNERLPEAKALIDKALSLAPDDAFITDSLGWVLFRMGQVKEAAALLKKAFGIRQDVEIAVHLGEVLWTLGNKDAAIGYFKQAQTLQPGNELLKSTLLRLNIKL
jgi:tetratricopeptide (TPR) repeat protein